MKLAEKQTWLELAYCPSVTAKKRAQLWQKTTEEDLWEISIQQFLTLFFKREKAAQIKRELAAAVPDKQAMLFISDPDYPVLLREIYEPPPVLFYEGHKQLLTKQLVAVVGSRKMTGYGSCVTERVVTGLAAGSIIICSGLALGVDGKAHQVALENEVGTVAVLGSGFSRLYPKQHTELARRIAAKGLLISEHHPMIAARSWHFPERNRIISGMAAGTLVVEAQTRSGSLITAELALEQNRLVYAVPGSILDKASSGTNQLLAEGAIVVREAADIIETLPVF